MKRLLLVLVSIAAPFASAFVGMVLILLANPEVNIDEGWRLGWIGLGSGLLVGLLGVGWFWWRRLSARLR